jgi:hypothetical protein
MQILLVLFLAIPLLACGGGDLTPPARRTRVNVGRLQSDHAAVFKPTLKLTPETVTLAPSETQSFSAVINYEPDGPRYPRQPVTWTLVEADGGEVSRNGLYTAPATPGTYHVKAEREDHKGVSETATITVKAPVAPSKHN